MMKMVLAVILSLAVMAIYAEALSLYHNKELGADGDLEIGSNMGMNEEVLGIAKRRVPAACTAECDCQRLSRGACNYCRYIRYECRQRYGNIVDA